MKRLPAEDCAARNDLYLDETQGPDDQAAAAGNAPAGLVARLKHWLGLDRAIIFTVMARLWSGLAGVVTVLLIARLLTPTEQGYYFTFSSLVALQIVFELGFSFVILQLAAHERGHMTILPDGRIEGDAVSHARLASVLQKAVRWYSVAGLVMAVVLLPTGLYFFGLHQTAAAGVEWKIPWCLLVVATMLAFQIDPVFSFLEGCGFVTQLAQRRLVQALLGSLLAWAAMAIHHGLYAPAMVILGQVAVGLAFLLSAKLRPLLKDLLHYPVGEHYVGWRREIWPFQWRIAVSWLCGYFIFQLINPVLFALQGPVAAGRMGMSLSVAGSLWAVATAWMNTKASPFGNMVARGEIAVFEGLFFRTLWQSTILLAVGLLVFFQMLLIVYFRFPGLAMRVLAPWAFGLVLLTTLFNHILSSETLYMRAHKREPMIVQTVGVAIMLGIATPLLAKFSGANAVAVGYFAISGVVGLAWGTYIFVTLRREWYPAPAQRAFAVSLD